MSVRQLARVVAWSVAWLLAAGGVLLVVAAWRDRTEVREPGLHFSTLYLCGSVRPRRVNLFTWRAADFDPFGDGNALWHTWTYGPLSGHAKVVRSATADDSSLDHDFDHAGWSLRRGEFGVSRGRPDSPTRTHVIVPAWFAVAGLLAPLGVLAVRRRRRRGRDRAGLCRACGYDLRASPTRCPECGAVPVAGGSDGRRQP